MSGLPCVQTSALALPGEFGNILPQRRCWVRWPQGEGVRCCLWASVGLCSACCLGCGVSAPAALKVPVPVLCVQQHPFLRAAQAVKVKLNDVCSLEEKL